MTSHLAAGLAGLTDDAARLARAGSAGAGSVAAAADDAGRVLRAGDLAAGAAPGAGERVLGWGIQPHLLEGLERAELAGATVTNTAETIRRVASKGSLAPVLERAGIAHDAGGTAVRTADELTAAVEAVGGRARITGGMGYNRLTPTDQAAAMVPGHLDMPPVAHVRGADDLAALREARIDHDRVLLVQAARDEAEAGIVVLGDEVVPAAAGRSLDADEIDVARRAADAFGLDAGQVDVVREAGTGRVLVRDVHATPQVDAARLEELASHPALRSIAPRTSAGAGISAAEAHETGKVAVGVLNTGQRPGKNIGRVMAEIEAQGARPVFVPTRAAALADDGRYLVPDPVAGGMRPLGRVDVNLVRTGSVIDDQSLQLLRELERHQRPLVNSAEAMELVRDKNVQARVLMEAGVQHPVSRTVAGVADADDAIASIGTSMVLKNPASSEGRGVMFLEGEDKIRDVVRMFESMTDASTLRVEAAGASGAAIRVTGRESAERAIRTLGDPVMTADARTGAELLQMQRPVRVVDDVTGLSAELDTPVEVLTVTQAFDDAKPGAVLKAEHWYREAAGVDTRVHVARALDGEHRVIAAMERRAAPNIWGEPRSNLSLGGGATQVTLTPAQEEAAIRGARAFDLDVAGVDLLDSAAGPVVLEVNSSPGLDIEKAVGSVADRWVELARGRGAAGAADAAAGAGLIPR